MKTKLIILALYLGCLWPVKAQSLQNDQSLTVFPGTSIILPVESSIKLKWILSPGDPATVKKATNDRNDLLFSVDKDNQPWVGHSNQFILNPSQGYQIRLSHTFNGFIHLDNGALLFSTPTEMGIAVSPKELKKDQNSLPVIPFQPVSALPLHDCRMFKGSDNSLYFAGRNLNTGGNEIYVIKMRSSGASGISDNLFGQFHRIFSTQEAITAVAGNGGETWIALGGLVIKVSGSEKSVTKVRSSPDQDIKQLIYIDNTGLVYSTGTKVGYIGQKGSMEFLTAPLHSIVVQNGNLYLLFHESLGVLSVENITGLKKMDVSFGKVVPKPVTDLKIASVRFFEYGPPEYSGAAYAESFDRSATRYLSCQADLENLVPTVRNSHSITTYWYTSTNELVHSNTVLVSFTEGEKSKSAFLTMGDDKAGSFFPGLYTVKIYVDASYAAEKKFNVFGEVNCFDAIRYHDTELLKELLDNSADPNQKNDALGPLLHYAVVKGRLEDVRLLIKAKANVNTINGNGETALFLAGWPAVSDGMAKALLLINSGINVEAKDRQGKTAFFNSALPEWNQDFSKLLLLNGANINSVDASGKSVLSTLISHADIWGIHSDIIEFLLSKGARMNTDPENSDFINLLQDEPNPDYVRLFLKYGAKIYQTGADDRSPAGNPSSLLNSAMLTYLACLKTDDRPNVQKALEIVNLLVEKGAKLLPAEEKIILNRDIIEILDTEYIIVILDRNNDLLLKAAQLNDPRIQSWVLGKLLNSIKSRITSSASDNDLSAALKLNGEVRKITEGTGDNAWPEIYLYSGLLEQHFGSNEAAESDLRKYISLMLPESGNMDEIKSMVKDLARKNKKKN
jgi:hypothetical protein